MVAHESGHIGYGSYEISFINLVRVLSKKHTLPEFFVKKIINVVEDVRINAINNIKFPGFYKNLRKFTKELLPELKIKMRKFGDILIYINLYMEDYQDFQLKPKFRSREMSQDDWRCLSIAKNFLLKTLTPASSIITSDQICKILKKYYKKKIIKKTPPRGRYTSQAENKMLVYEDESGYHIVDTGMDTFSEKDDHNEFDNRSDSDFMEDPWYYEDVEPEAYDDYYFEDSPILNHYEDFNDKNGIMKETELNKTSEKIIENIKNSDITTEDIEKFIDRIDMVKECKDEILSKENSYLSFDFKEPTEDIKKEFNSQLRVEDVLHHKETDDKDRLTELLANPIIKDVIEEKEYLPKLIELITDAHNAMEDRLFILEKGISFEQLTRSDQERKIKEARIENESMKPINISYNQIIETYKNLIARIKFIFSEFKNQADIDNFQKRGRLNNKFIKAVTSEYKYKKCFSRKLYKKELKILLLVDISGSMRGIKLESAKIAMIMLCEALHEIAQLRIVLFTGDYDALNILLKDFNDKPEPRKFDKFGCHANICSNLDGISMKHEASKLEKETLIIIISDGQPAGSRNYGLYDAIKEIHDVKILFKVFAFSIDAKGDYLDKLYDKNWVLTKSSDKIDLGEKLIKFCKLVVKEFFR
ncbi:MAG: hypothetical protein ACFFA3_06405 [Promethearchaeota archaeon]